MSDATRARADDDDDILLLVTTRLRRDGFEVVLGARTATLRSRSRASARRRMAVLDIGMPGLDGLEVSSRSAPTRSSAACWSLLLTAKAQESDVRRGYEAGADAYVRKPFSPAELSTRVARAGRRRAASAGACSGSRSRARSRSARRPARPGRACGGDSRRRASPGRRRRRSVAPDELEQLVPAQHLPRVADERREQAELERRQLHLAVADGDARLRPVNRQVGVGVGLGLLLSRPLRRARRSACTRATSSCFPNGLTT